MNILAKYSSILALFAILAISAKSYGQDQDSLLKQVSEIEVVLDSPPDSTENLYLNNVSFQSFYDLLSPMGQWIQLTKEEVDEDLGEGNGQGIASDMEDGELLFVWKPADATADWRPYSNGHWVYTDRGWVWFGNESWAGAVYHYGRWWHSAKFGWLWMPGYVWAPAWVEWRIAEGQIGWRALTPRAKWRIENGISEHNYKFNGSDADWVFVKKSGFDEEIGSGSILAAGENSKYIAGSRSLINIKAENDVIMNSGPDAREIEKATGRQLNKRTLKFVRERRNSALTSSDVKLFKEPLTKYKAGEKMKNGQSLDKPGKFKRTQKAKKFLKGKRIRKIIRIHRHRM